MNSITGFEPNSLEASKSFDVQLSKDRKVTFTSKDPFGFLHASIEGEDCPEELQGVFTSPKEAREAVTRYLAKLPIETTPKIKNK